MKKFIFLVFFLFLTSFVSAQVSSPWDYEIKSSNLSWFNNTGTTLKTTIAGTDSAWSEIFKNPHIWDSIIVKWYVPSGDSVQVKLAVLQGQGTGTFAGTVFYDKTVEFDSVKVASVTGDTVKTFDLRKQLPAAAKFAQLRMRAYNTVAVPKGNGSGSAAPDISKTYFEVTFYGKPNTYLKTQSTVGDGQY